MFAAVDAPGESRRVARAEPREHGKSSVIALGVPLKKLAFREKKFILLVGESAAAAEANMQTIIEEVENNDLLLEDFPHLAPQIDKKGQLTKWTDRQLVFQSGATIVAKGMGTRMRGLKRQSFRPDLAILDDPESPETSDTFLKRKRHKNWFGGTFMGLGGPGWDIYVIGNLINEDSLIAALLTSDEWDSKVYRAENTAPRTSYKFPLGNTKTDGSALWPEVWPLERLQAYKRNPTVGTSIYAGEMMNDPRSDADRKFDTGQFVRFHFTPKMLDEFETVAGFLDPAGGQKPSDLRAGKKDFWVFVSAGRYQGKVRVFDVRMGKELPAVQIERLIDSYADFKHDTIGVEDNMFKNLIRPNIEERGRRRGLVPPIRAIHQTRNKESRILSIQPPIEAGTVEFAEHLFEMVPQYFEQFDEFPGTHDDGPDATEGVVRMVESGGLAF